MIYRQIKFDVVYRIADEWKREAVIELFGTPQFGITNVKTVSGLDVALDAMRNSLLQFTGQFDSVGREIYHGHLLANEAGDIYEVVSYNAGFWLLRSDETLALDDVNCMTMKIIGDAITNGALIEPTIDDAEEALKESTKRNQPPLVNLKKKT